MILSNSIDVFLGDIWLVFCSEASNPLSRSESVELAAAITLAFILHPSFTAEQCERKAKAEKFTPFSYENVAVLNKFQERSSISKYNTRNKRDLYFQTPNLDCIKKSFFYTGARAWNSIPQFINDARSVVALKKRLKTHFLS